jgi:hypothetical protein
MLTTAAAVDHKPVLMFLLVHGWRDDASPSDDALGAFKKLLGNLAQSDWSRDFSICGVYIGCRGSSIQRRGWFTFPAECLSFWGRKSVAEKIASTCASTAIFSLIDVARKLGPDPEKNPSGIVLAGHSLGAGILMNSVSQALAYEFARANSQTTNAASIVLESPANLILLLNPAVESVYLRQLRVSMQPVKRDVYPWLVSLTSETDSITKIIFPLAQWRASSEARKAPYYEPDWTHYDPAQMGTNSSNSNQLPERKPISQQEYATRTPGHNPYMRDFQVVIKSNSEKEIENLKRNFPNYEDIIAYNRLYGSHKYFLLKKEGEEKWPPYGYFNNLRPSEEIHPLFWVATVDRRIMDGHSLPFNEDARRENFIGTVMALMADSRVKYHTLPSMAAMKTPTQNATQLLKQKAVKRK